MPYRSGRRCRGRGLMDFAKKAHGYLKRTGLIGKMTGALSGLHPHMKTAHGLAKRFGYGRRRVRRRGGSRVLRSSPMFY